MTVDTDDEGKPTLSLNSGVKDDYFDLWTQLEAGTSLTIGESKTLLIVDGDGYQSKLAEMMKRAKP